MMVRRAPHACRAIDGPDRREPGDVLEVVLLALVSLDG